MGGILPIFVGLIPAEVLRAPGWGVTGWLSRKVMENVNSVSSVDLVEELLSVEQGSTIVELGPGHGFALRQILEKRPLRVFAVEVSESFRSILESDPAFREPIGSGTHKERRRRKPFFPEGRIS